jgi:hypothetical protein
MKLVSQRDYRRHTLLMFEQRVVERHEQPSRHWIVVAPDGTNVIGSQSATEEDACAFVDQLVDSPGERAARLIAGHEQSQVCAAAERAGRGDVSGVDRDALPRAGIYGRSTR